MLIVSINKMDNKILNNILLLQRDKPMPVLVFAEQGSSISVDEVIAAGTSVYVIDGYESIRMKSLIEVSVARHKQLQVLHEELESTKRSLDERRTIEKAKGIIMQQRSISEDKAYMVLRKAAMNESKKMVDIARSVIGIADILI
jgi:response regulator NasT